MMILSNKEFEELMQKEFDAGYEVGKAYGRTIGLIEAYSEVYSNKGDCQSLYPNLIYKSTPPSRKPK